MEIRVKHNQTLKDFTYGRKFVRGLASRSIAPVMLLEAFVEAGRTYQAYQRGGYTEARERITEEMIGAAFWFSGVPLFNNLIDKYIGQKIFKQKDVDFHSEKDSLRNPIKNFIKKVQTNIQKNPEDIEKMIAKYKFGKVMTSIVLANCLVGLVLPKVNQGITKHILKKKSVENTDTQQPNQSQNYSMDKFLNNKKDKPSFGAMSPQAWMSLAYQFENNPKYGLISTDLGVWVGRGACARNEHERTEVLFRDISSSYFYMFNMPVMAAFLNKIQDGKSTRLDPVAAQQVTDHLNEVLRVNGGSMKSDAFREFVLGKAHNAEGYIIPSISEELNKGKGAMKLERFVELLPEVKSKYPEIDIKKFEKAAKGMSELQPKIVGDAMLSKKQIMDIFSNGAINMPEFLKNVFRCSTSDQNLFTGKISDAAFDNEFVFISKETLEKKQKLIKEYVETIIKKAKNSDITSDLLKKVNRENYIKNAANWGIGFAVSAAFLSTFIPKIQYWITRKATGSNAFPGTADYSNEKKN